MLSNYRIAPSLVSQWCVQFLGVTTRPFDPASAVRRVRCVVMVTDNYKMGRVMSTPKTPASNALVKYEYI